ncbi:exopolysaccharide biosynthesis polyprenyl glycosylphosphotransferase [Lutibacter oricola]|uniref:Exopolysaccharide biosynthesis polyprenyl glycosylphosphotransferase n=1 Tax=Lutibacter oricola TaxID=762486 RepID=A0A1H2X2J3_9FLAO|nr:exopolysaccharide biosynthesis polyprenyl glycosylphosphotransferase [Lutibacter oricola]SDW86966.1 exopolysaccharide biosynthesis polyprenyl glycosylphosphotransferase [Lutibacter oricola]
MPHKNLHFSISERKIYLRFFDVVFIVLGLFGLSYVFDFEYFNFNHLNIYTWLLVLIIYYYFFGQIFELFNLKIASDYYSTFKSVALTVLFTAIFYVFTPKVSPILPEQRLEIGYFAFTILISVLLNRFLYIALIFSPRFLKNILVIGSIATIESLLQKNERSKSNRITTYISNKQLRFENSLVFSDIENVDIASLINKQYIKEILVCSNSEELIGDKVNNQLINLFEKGLSIRSIDSFLESETFKISESQLTSNFYNYFSFSKSHENNLYLAFRRLFDILFSAVGILYMLILIPIIYIINFFGNKGKLFYIQERVGEKGKCFRIVKFRTMVSNAEQNGVQWAQKGDSRITSFGRILRKTRIDEVPQFINVLKGEMSLIGPRPERPEFVKQLEQQLPYYALRHVIKPGLTGWAQVMHPYASSVKDQREKLMYDLYYIKERDLILDLKIVIKTISTVLFFRGT